MAVTLAGTRLTEAHRIAQARISAATVRDLLRVWPLLDHAAIEATMPSWLSVAVPVVQRHRLQSAKLGRIYYERMRRIEVPDADRFVPPALRPAPLDQITTSLIVTGPVTLRKAIAALAATDVAEASQAAAGARHAVNGGREAVLGAVEADKVATGARRITAPGACAFCSMLAVRSESGLSSDATGFKTDGSMREVFKVHDNCNCTAEPAWDSGAGQTSRNRELAALYAEATAGVGSSNNGKLNAYRNALAEQRT